MVVYPVPHTEYMLNRIGYIGSHRPSTLSSLYQVFIHSLCYLPGFATDDILWHITPSYCQTWLFGSRQLC